PKYLAGLANGVKAIGSNTQIAAQIGTGGPNPWNVSFVEALGETQKWVNSFINPYNFDGFAPIATLVAMHRRVAHPEKKQAGMVKAVRLGAGATTPTSLVPPGMAEHKD